jgi:pyrroloquinoline quinone (PQQ) biosynthesis protein C
MKARSLDFVASVRRVENRVREHPTLSHPIFDVLARGSVPRLRAFALEQYRLSVTFPQALAALYSNAPDLESQDGPIPAWKLALPLMNILSVEYWGTHVAEAHSRSFVELAFSLGLSREDLYAHRPIDSTRDFCSFRTRYCRDAAFPAAVASLAFANEFSNLIVFSRYLRAVESINSRTGANVPLGYFLAHTRDEHSDYAEMTEILEAFASVDDRFEQQMQVGTEALLSARERWYDALQAHLLGVP